MQKYLKVQTDTVTSRESDCDRCCYDGENGCEIKPRYACRFGEHYILNQAWKPASQRLREFNLDLRFIGTGSKKLELLLGVLNELADELEQEEKENQ